MRFIFLDIFLDTKDLINFFSVVGVGPDGTILEADICVIAITAQTFLHASL